jgi:hypothetical protein
MIFLLKRNWKALKKPVWKRKTSYKHEGGQEVEVLSGYRFLPLNTLGELCFLAVYFKVCSSCLE